MKKIVMDYEKRQDKADRELYASNRLLKAHKLPIKCLDEQKRALRARLRIETNPDRMTAKILSGDDFDAYITDIYNGLEKASKEIFTN